MAFIHRRSTIPATKADIREPAYPAFPDEPETYELLEAIGEQVQKTTSAQSKSDLHSTHLPLQKVDSVQGSMKQDSHGPSTSDFSPAPSILVQNLAYAIPIAISSLVSGLLLVLVIFTAFRPIVAPASIQRLAIVDPKLWTGIFTVISTALSGLLGYCYSSSTTMLLRKRMRARPHSFRRLSDWLTFNHQDWTKARGFRWLLLTTGPALLLGVLTTCINALIIPVAVPISLRTGAFYDPNFADEWFSLWYLQGGNFGPCSSWSAWPGSQPGPCMVNSSLPSFLEAGRAAVTSLKTPVPSFSYLGNYTFVGSSGGVWVAGPWNTYDSVRMANQGGPYSAWTFSQTWSFAMKQQGLSASIQCTTSSTSPLSFETVDSPSLGVGNLIKSFCDCGATDASEAVTLWVQDSWADAGQCQDTGTIRGTWFFYLRLHGQYVVDGIENITCTISPYLANTTVTYTSQTDVFNVSNTVPVPVSNTSFFGPMVQMLPQVVYAAQNAQGNLVVDSVMEVAVDNVFGFDTATFQESVLDGMYLYVWECYLRGWLESIGSNIRLDYLSLLDPGGLAQSGPITLLYPPGTDYYAYSGELQAQPYGWQFSSLSLIFLAPVFAVTFLTLAFFTWTLGTLRHIPTTNFDPTDPVALLLAGVAGDDSLKTKVQTARLGEGDPLKDVETREMMVIFRDGVVTWIEE